MVPEPSKHSSVCIPLTPNIRAMIRRVEAKSGGPAWLGPILHACPNVPPTLNEMQGFQLLNGQSKSVRRSVVRFIEYLDLAPAGSFDLERAKAELRSTHILLTPDLVGEMLWRKNKTGIGPQKLLSGKQDKPDGLDSGLVNNWLSAQTRSARPEHAGYVLHLWRNAPIMMELSDEDRAALRNAMDQAGLTPQSLLNRMEQRPPGLTPDVLSRWLAGKVNRVNAEWWGEVAASADRRVLGNFPTRSQLLSMRSWRSVVRPHRPPSRFRRHSHPLLSVRLGRRWLARHAS